MRRGGHGLCVQRSAGVEDVIDFYTAVADIVDGERSLEEASTDVHLLTQIAYIALSDVLHPTLIVAGAGHMPQSFEISSPLRRGGAEEPPAGGLWRSSPYPRRKRRRNLGFCHPHENDE